MNTWCSPPLWPLLFITQAILDWPCLKCPQRINELFLNSLPVLCLSPRRVWYHYIYNILLYRIPQSLYDRNNFLTEVEKGCEYKGKWAGNILDFQLTRLMSLKKTNFFQICITEGSTWPCATLTFSHLRGQYVLLQLLTFVILNSNRIGLSNLEDIFWPKRVACKKSKLEPETESREAVFCWS